MNDCFDKDNIKYCKIDALHVSVGNRKESAAVDNHQFVDLVIPKTVNGFIITEIGYGAFTNQYSLEHVTILAKINKIYDHAFYCCPNLSVINIPSSVVSLGAGAISGLSENGAAGKGNIDVFFDYPSSLQTLDYLAFEQKESFTIYFGGNKVPSSIDSMMFKNAKSVKIYSITAMKFNDIDTIPIGREFFARHACLITRNNCRKTTPRVALVYILLLIV